MTTSAAKLARTIVAGLVGVTACAGEAPTTALAPSTANLALGEVTNSTPEFGKIKVCKSASSNVSGSFTIALTMAAGLFTRLATREAESARMRPLGAVCDCCCVPECERTLLGR